MTASRYAASPSYERRIADVLGQLPDLRLYVAEHASNGKFLLVRGVARRTGVVCPVELSGVERIQLRDGLVKETWLYYGPAVFDALVLVAGAAGRNV